MLEEIENENSNKKPSTFLLKLYQILEVKLSFYRKNREYDNIVKWSETGNSFIVKNLNEFTEKVIPKHFKHSNFSSFVRQVRLKRKQLNMYDFHKTKTKLNESQFSHKMFSCGNM